MDIEEEIARNVKASLDARQAPQGVSVGEIAAALMPLVRRAQAEALREAAADNGHGWALRTWLAGRANRIEQEVEHE